MKPMEFYRDLLAAAVHNPQVLSIKPITSLRWLPGCTGKWYVAPMACGCNALSNSWQRVNRVFVGAIRQEHIITQIDIEPKEPRVDADTAPLEYLPAEGATIAIKAETDTLSPSTSLLESPFDKHITADPNIELLTPLPAPGLVVADISILPHRSLNFYDFVEDRYIGSGAWGAVHLARHRKTGQQVAIKSIQKARVVGTEIQILREQQTLRAVVGQNGALDLLASFHDDPAFLSRGQF